MKTDQTPLPLAVNESQLAHVQPTSMQILETAVKGGITGENVAVVKEILAMRREEMAAQSKTSFNRAFFRLKQEIATMDFYADKAATNKSGGIAYTYCSENELTFRLEPVLFKHGFAMLFGQHTEGERVVAEITLIHEDGHEEKRSYAVRTGVSNAMKDNTAVDTGSTTSAWRHLVIKMFGLKSRIREDGDARNEGERITWEQVLLLKEQIAETGMNEASFFTLAGCEKFEEITSGRYPVLINALAMKARAKK